MLLYSLAYFNAGGYSAVPLVSAGSGLLLTEFDASELQPVINVALSVTIECKELKCYSNKRFEITYEYCQMGQLGMFLITV